MINRHHLEGSRGGRWKVEPGYTKKTQSIARAGVAPRPSGNPDWGLGALFVYFHGAFAAASVYFFYYIQINIHCAV